MAGNMTVLGGATQADNDPHRADYIRRDQSDLDRQISTRLSAAEIRTFALVGGLAFVAMLGVLALLRWASCLGATSYDVPLGCTAARGLFWLWLVGGVAAGVGTPAVLLYGRWQRQRAEVERASITRDAYSNPVPARLVQNMSFEAWAALFTARQDAEISMAPYKVLPAGLDSFSQSIAAPKGNDAPQLGATTPQPVAALPAVEWLPMVDKYPHVMLGGTTGAGKSTTTHAIVAPRIERGEQLFIIDPHSSGWFGLQGVGGGEDWPTIKRAIDAVHAEYKRRLDERERHKRETGTELPHDHHPRLTVLVDEANLLHDALGSVRRNEVDYWQMLATTLGSGARKVNISIVLLAQSANVEDLSLSGPMRANFTRLALDHRAARLLIEQEVKDAPTTRQQLLAALVDTQYPAVGSFGGKVQLLSREGLDKVPDPSGLDSALWSGWDYDQGAPSVCLNDDLLNGLLAGVSQQTDEDAKEKKIHALALLIARGVSRDEARDTLGLQFDNTDWTAAGELVKPKRASRKRAAA